MTDWDARVAGTWARSAEVPADELIAVIDALVAELPDDDPRGPFEAAGARDNADREAEAEPLYRRALELGLDGIDRERAVIQLASTLRNLGRPAEAIALLDEAMQRAPVLMQPMLAFTALALVDLGRPVEAARIAMTTLSEHLPEYGGAVARYASVLTD